MKTLSEAMERVDYPGVDLSHLRFDPTGATEQKAET